MRAMANASPSPCQPRSEIGRVSPDPLRSVTNLTDDSGATAASYHLDAWGNFRNPDELNASQNRFAFTGYQWDSATGLYNAKARFYDPLYGRFTSQDSYLGEINDPPSIHRYFYANDNPMRYIDPTGHAGLRITGTDSTRDFVDPEDNVRYRGGVTANESVEVRAYDNPREQLCADMDAYEEPMELAAKLFALPYVVAGTVIAGIATTPLLAAGGFTLGATGDVAAQVNYEGRSLGKVLNRGTPYLFPRGRGDM
jgi:RHS repeat-associated protein